MSDGILLTFPSVSHCPICTEPLFGDFTKCADDEDIHWTMRKHPGTSVVVLKECHHQFHLHCVGRWLDELSTTCPVCRGEVHEDEIIEIDEAYTKLNFETRGAFSKTDEKGNTFVYAGRDTQMRLVSVESADGTLNFYKGAKGAERKVRVEFVDGTKKYYSGKRGHERKVRIKFASGVQNYFEGWKGSERLVRVEFVDGQQEFFEGEWGAEKKVSAKFTNGDIHFYEGELGAERVVYVKNDGN